MRTNLAGRLVVFEVKRSMTMVALPDFEREFTHAPFDYHETTGHALPEAPALDLGRATQTL